MPSDTPRTRAKRAQILAAARALFLSQGYARTSTDAITEVAGISKQTLYAHYRGKAELLAAIIGNELDELQLDGRVHPAPHTHAELRDLLFTFARAVTTKLLQPDALALLRLLVGEAVHVPELRDALRQAFPARLIGAMERALQHAQSLHLIHTLDANLSARMFVGPVMSYVALDGLFSSAPPDIPDDRALTHLVDLFLLTVTPTTGTGGKDHP